MAITYSGVTNTITVTGYTEATPCNFTDIYNADVAGGWGVVTRQCTNQFCFDAILQIGDGSTTTWFADIQKQVIFNELGGSWQGMIIVYNHGRFRSGELVNSSLKSTRDGCSIFMRHTSNPKFLIRANSTTDTDIKYEIYSTHLESVGTYRAMAIGGSVGVGSTITIYNSLFVRGGVNRGICDINNLTITGKNAVDAGGAAYSWRTLAYCTGTLNNLFFYDVRNGMYFSAATPSTLKNVVLRDYYEIYAAGVTVHNYVINGDLDHWSFDWSGVNTHNIYRQYEFDLKVIDKDNVAINGATAKIWDKDDSLITNTTTNASGVIATQTLNYGYYNQAGGNTPTMRTPHEMRIYKYGKSMLSSKSTIEAKTDWAFTMYDDDHITQITEATVAAYTGITISHTTNTITISADHTLDEIYDYCQYDIIAAAHQIDQSMHTSDGINFVSEYSFVVNTGITVTATDQKLTMAAGYTYTLSGTAQFAGIIATTTTTRIPIKLTNIIDGSRYWVGKESDGSEIFDGTQSGSGTVTGYYEHTANIDIDIRVRKSSASVKYKPWVGEGTLIAEAFSLRIRQIQDSIIT